MADDTNNTDYLQNLLDRFRASKEALTAPGQYDSEDPSYLDIAKHAGSNVLNAAGQLSPNFTIPGLNLTASKDGQKITDINTPDLKMAPAMGSMGIVGEAGEAAPLANAANEISQESKELTIPSQETQMASSESEAIPAEFRHLEEGSHPISDEISKNIPENALSPGLSDMLKGMSPEQAASIFGAGSLAYMASQGGGQEPPQSPRAIAQAPSTPPEIPQNANIFGAVSDKYKDLQKQGTIGNNQIPSTVGPKMGSMFGGPKSTQVSQTKGALEQYIESLGTDKNLSNAQQQQANAVLINQLGKAGELIGSSIAHAKPVAQEAFDQNIKLAGQITQDVKDRIENQKNDSNSPMSKTFRDLLKDRFKANIPNNASAADLEKAFPVIARAFEADEARKARHEDLALKYAQMHKEVADKKDAKLADLLQKDIDPDQARTGNFGAVSKMKFATERANAIFQQFPDYNVPKSQTTELATAVASIISGGSPQSQHMIDELTPQSMKGKYNDIAAWITNNPTGREQQDFMKALHTSVIRENDLANDKIKEIQISRLPRYEQLKRDNPELYNAMLQSKDIRPEDINEKGQYVKKQGPMHLMGGANTVTIRDSQGIMHTLPKQNLDAAKQRDPGLQVIQ